ncbi:hypothetical protein N7457_005587 [Penicillium paradoxum]|uniref:uncharacterized protein n=1 Tax=Penicillium paradoxum TaxID=176176 RepID=UPI00254962DD|nr:uncharacterized protein N7457_005587 [Penicillium paradoxum]KAJ5780427.1 hypothetical protein N7457_005587 [Penicillium paradoxum]
MKAKAKATGPTPRIGIGRIEYDATDAADDAKHEARNTKHEAGDKTGSLPVGHSNSQPIVDREMHDILDSYFVHTRFQLLSSQSTADGNI